MQWIYLFIFSYLFHDALVRSKISSIGKRKTSFGTPDNPEAWTVFLSQQRAWGSGPEDVDSRKLSQVHQWSLMISFLSASWSIVLVSTWKGKAWTQSGEPAHTVTAGPPFGFMRGCTQHTSRSDGNILICFCCGFTYRASKQRDGTDSSWAHNKRRQISEMCAKVTPTNQVQLAYMFWRSPVLSS